MVLHCCVLSVWFKNLAPLSQSVVSGPMVSVLDFELNSPGSRPGRGTGLCSILLVTLCFRNQDKLLPDRPLGSYADFTFVIVQSDDCGFGLKTTLIIMISNTLILSVSQHTLHHTHM